MKYAIIMLIGIMVLVAGCVKEFNPQTDTCQEYLINWINTPNPDFWTAEVGYSNRDVFQKMVDDEIISIKECTDFRKKDECELGNSNFVETIITSCGYFAKDQWELNWSQCKYITRICIEEK